MKYVSSQPVLEAAAKSEFAHPLFSGALVNSHDWATGINGSVFGLDGHVTRARLSTVGDNVGDTLGDTLGDTVGDTVGETVGDTDGDLVGETVGDTVGDCVGETVGSRNLDVAQVSRSAGSTKYLKKYTN